MAFSIEAITKNTFISFKLEAADTNDGEVSSSLRGSPRMPRSRSAEIVRSKPEANELEEKEKQSLENLTAVLSSGVLQPSTAETHPVSKCRGGSRVSSPAAARPPASPKRGLGLRSKQAYWDQDLRVDSSCSLSTMAPDEMSELAFSPQLKAVGSSNSISSMVSWADMYEEEEDVLFEMQIEENPSTSDSQANVTRQVTSEATCKQVQTEKTSHGAPFQLCHVGALGRPAAEHTIGKVTPEMSHGLVPKTQDMASIYHSSKDQPPTTLMIRNIPGKYSQTDLMNDLIDAGFGGTFNFLYLPIDKVTSNNVGYAFVNFVYPCIAANCMQHFEGYHFAQISKSTRKRARISVAHLQGLEKNLAHYEKTAVNVAPEKQRRPVIIANISSMMVSQPPGIWA